jgi:intein-encoded DNA endonuclease-like protein
MPNSKLTKEQKTVVLELYKCHFTARETAALMDIEYSRIAAIFRGFKISVKKYDRLNLIQNSALLDSLSLNNL